MNEYERLRRIAERLRKEYPTGTRIQLIKMGDDPRPIEPGTRGTVKGVDDMASVMVDWDNGRGLSLVYGEDQFRALTMDELEEEKSEAMQQRYIDKVNQEVIPIIEWVGMRNAYKRGDMSVPTDLLKNLHNAFVEIYGDYLESDQGFVTVPGVVKVANGNIYPALLDLDTSSSGEHWGTTFFTPEGVLDDHSDLVNVKNVIKQFIPYEYWYIPYLERDHHVSFDECPKEVLEMLSEATGEDFTERMDGSGGQTF